MNLRLQKFCAKNQKLVICSFRMALPLLFMMLSSSAGQEIRFGTFNADTYLNFNDITCSPDGKNVYVCGLYTIAALKVEANGSLNILQVLNNDYNGFKGVYNPSDVAVSPDGRYLYAVDISTTDRKMLVFTRDIDTGSIELIEIIQDTVFTSQSAAGPYHELLFSPEGKYLYWLNSPYGTSGALNVFECNLESGHATRIQTSRKGDSHFGDFDIPRWLAISSDGKHFYGGGDHHAHFAKILILYRNLQHGGIDSVKSHDIESWRGEKWERGSVTVSPDGEALYLADVFLGELLVFSRNRLNGEVEQLQSFSLNSARSLAVSPNSAHIYVKHYDRQSYFAIFAKDSDTEELTLVNDKLLQLNDGNPIQTLMSPTGDAIYMLDEKRLTVIRRDTVSGSLDQPYYLTQNDFGGTDRLHASRAVKISQDGRFLYVAARHEDAGITTFERDQQNGQLSLREHLPLERLWTMSISPDRRHFYALSLPHNLPINNLTVLAADSLSGKLNIVQQFTGGSLNSTAMAFSREGTNFYCNPGTSLLVYARDPASGRLVQQQSLVNADYGLGTPSSFAISPDGLHFYWHGIRSSDLQQLATFVRDPTIGTLTFVNKQELGSTLTAAARALQISPDGRFVYASTAEIFVDAPGILIFRRNAQSGELTSAGKFEFEALCEMRDLAISADGLMIYALAGCGGYSSPMMAVLRRDPESGQLTLEKQFRSGKEGVYGMFDPEDLTLSPDERFLYVADLGGVATFATGRSATRITEKHDNRATLPKTLQLEQNYPNPFSSLSTSATLGASTTTIRYEIPVASKQAVPVELAIYNLHGRLVRTLVNELKIGGRYSAVWNAFDAHGKPVPSGLYFYRLKSGDSVITRRLLLVK